MSIRFGAGVLIATLLSTAPAWASVTIDAYEFDLTQFDGAAVTYRSDGGVTFDGKLWDNHVGVDGVTTGELASGQFGGDPGDQLSLNSRGAAGPDWFQLDYAGAGLTIGGSDRDTFVVYEITSSSAGVDTEGTSWRISFNGGAFIDASSGVAKFLQFTPAAENVNQIAFDLTSFGFTAGDLLKSVRFENKDTGSSTSDPDFIFTALEGSVAPVPEATSIIAWGGLLGAVGLILRKKR
ncbi:hypothetical protein Pla175_27980 [Pirellulimonas nuda]|uniref:PEP-CTERM protein-sorting domain-containing protein n=1 Tax=Pirellulimonas nuda TaxID=2528009 RepID=A0A518DD56_9BACT|nr:hypothetical protein [Pirellulimonas nuda]QDU89408.1 hypothetical protein Pla175_27980 [Pirellulimonas nuda]